MKGNDMKVNFVEITNEPAEAARPYQDKATGLTKMISGAQNAYLHCGKSYPVPFKMRVDDVTGPLRPGFYVMVGEMFKPGKYDRLEFDDRKLGLAPVSDLLDFFNNDERFRPTPIEKLAKVG